MSDAAPSHTAQLIRHVLLPAVLIFVLPLAAWLFTQHTLGSWDAEVESQQFAQIDADPTMSVAERADAKAFIAAHPLSRICTERNASEGVLAIRASLGGTCDSPAQFGWARTASQLALLLGLFGVLVMALGTAAAFGSRRLQLISLRVGWNVLTLLSAVQVVLQGALFVWLSFWVTAEWFGFYAPKLIGLVGIMAALAIFQVIRAIFVRPDPRLEVEGELLHEEDAPAFWAHLRALAEQVGTPAPDHVIVGIDDNFFVVETPVTVGTVRVEGRVLYVSLRFLRQFERDELDVVLAHELAHLLGGDSGHTKQLAPHLNHFDAYLSALSSNALCWPVGAFMNAFAVLFHLALQRQRRAAEFAADAVAARVVSGEALMRSLVRLAAHAHFRGRVELEAFKASTVGSLGFRQRLSEGFAGYADSSALNEDLESVLSTGTPHPFDSHPPLTERAAAVGAPVTLAQVPGLLGPPRQTWWDTIPGAEAIEGRLWTRFEAEFAEAHERELAYRFGPDTDAERAIVEKYFPAQEFETKKGEGPYLLDHARLVIPAPKEAILPLAGIHDEKLEEALVGKKLRLVATAHGGDKDQTFEVHLRHLVDPDAFLQAIDHYLFRQRSAVAHREQAEAGDGAGGGATTGSGAGEVA